MFQKRKNLLLIMLLGFLISSSYLSAQTMYLASFQKKISIEFNNINFEDALKLLHEKTNIAFSYNRDQLPIKTKINKSFTDQTIKNIVQYLLNNTNCILEIPLPNQYIIKLSKKKSIKSKMVGKVIDAKTKQPLIGVNVLALNKYIGDATNEKGNFELLSLIPGNYDFRFNYLGYKSQTITNIKIEPGDTKTIIIQLQPQALMLDHIVVTPGSFSVMGNKSLTMQSLTKEDIEDLSFGEDIYRAITRIPGISANDFSAKFNIRGGEDNEVLVMLDGMELTDPFHVKDIMGGALSIVDATIIQNADILTGGFNAEYGNKMSGVFNISSIQPTENTKSFSASLSMMNARIMSKGTFNNSKSSYIFSARRGYLDLVLDLLDEAAIPKPTYYDIYGKIEHKLNDKHTLSLSVLHAGDKFNMKEDDLDNTKSDYSNNYAWLNLKSIISKDLLLQTVASYSYLTHNRYGIGFFGNGESMDKQFEINDKRKLSLAGLKFDFTYNFEDKLTIKAGSGISYGKADYKYHSQYFLESFDQYYLYTRIPKENLIDYEPTSTLFNSYISSKFKITDKLVSELGLRYDYNSLTKESLASPRISLAYLLGEKTFIRSSWGIFNQSQKVNELRIQNAERNFSDSQTAEHYVLGFEHQFNNGFNFRIEGYYKKMTNLLTGFKNIGKTIYMFPEVHKDLLIFDYDYAEAKGIETYLKYDNGGKFSFWTSYSLTLAKEFVNSIISLNNHIPINEDVIPRDNVSKHTFYFDVNYRPSKYWHFNLAFQYRSGGPITLPGLFTVQTSNGSRTMMGFNNYNGSNLPQYRRTDIKITRNFFTSVGKFRLFLEILNIEGRNNIRSYDFYTEYYNNKPKIIQETAKWFPLMPSFGISWETEL